MGESGVQLNKNSEILVYQLIFAENLVLKFYSNSTVFDTREFPPITIKKVVFFSQLAL